MKFVWYILLTVFFLTIVAVIFQQTTNSDTLYHLKAGEIYTKYGLIRHDVFSYVTSGRQWFPQEWLFQIALFRTVTIFGFGSLPYLTAILTYVQLICLFLIGRNILKLGKFTTLLLLIVYAVLNVEFFVLRPYLLSLLFFTTEILLVILFIRTQKKVYLVPLPFLLYLWINIHASAILALLLIYLYGYTTLIVYLLWKKREYINATSWLLLTALVCTFSTILPPQGTSQYQLLLLFMHSSSVLAYFPEWKSVAAVSEQLYIYLGIVLTGLTLAWQNIIHQKQKFVLTIPLLVFFIFPFLAVRNIVYAYISLFFIVAIAFEGSVVKTNKKHVCIYVLVLCLSGLLLWQKLPTPVTYPTQAVSFLQKHPLRGKMFNIFSDGSYLMYSLYPKYKIFIDLRTDLYADHELPDYQKLAVAASLPDDQYAQIVDEYLQKNKFDFMVLDYHLEQFAPKLGRIIEQNPDWSLVFWDDGSEIFIKRNDLNSEVIQMFGVTAATPYSSSPYRNGEEEQALVEYERMSHIGDSAKTENAIGVLLIHLKRTADSGSHFQKAILLQPQFLPAYLNLATTQIYSKSYQNAINTYEKIHQLDSQNSDAYLYEGEIYLKIYNDSQKAREVFENGLNTVSDEKGKSRLESVLNTLP